MAAERQEPAMNEPAMNARLIRDLAIAILPVVLASWLGSLATAPAIPTWYAGLAKPWFTPPNWAFPVAWTILYALMAWAVFRVLRKPAATPGRTPALLVYWLQLGFNALWSWAFFHERSTLFGLLVIVPLLALIVITIRRFAVVDRLASLMLWPYAAWVGYATLLNLSLWWLNR